MFAPSERLEKFVLLDFLRDHGEIGFYVEWREPRTEVIPTTDGFEASFIDEERELALIVPVTDVPAEAYQLQHQLLDRIDWLDCWSEVMLVKLPAKERNEKHQLLYDLCAKIVTVMYSDDQVDIFVFHRADDLYNMAMGYQWKSSMLEPKVMAVS